MKYEGRNPLEKLREGEPYFFLRAQDKLSTEAIRAYGNELKRESDKAFAVGDNATAKNLFKQSLEMFRVIERFMDWQDDNEQFVKLPD